MKIYLAAQFARIDELRGYKAELEAEGVVVTSRWLLGGHERVSVPGEEIPVAALPRFAEEDLEDIDRADLVICFTEPPGAGPARGGKDFEAGYAYAIGVPVMVVGPVENVFYALRELIHAPDWATARPMILDVWHRAAKESERHDS